MASYRTLLARRWRLAAIVAAFVAVGVLVGTLVVPQYFSQATTTGVSTIYQTATNTTNGTTAASSDAPGGVKTGTSKPGDTIKWVVNYQNSTGADASVNLKDPLTATGAYVPGSLQLPPNGNAVGTLTPQYSTNGGTSWANGTPPSNANGVGFTGTMVPQGTQQKSVNLPSPVSQTLTNSGGDGYNGVVSADGLRVYAVFHHSYNDVGTLPVYCAVIATGGVCPGWPGNNTSVSPVPGSAIGAGLPGGSGFQTGWQNGTYINGTQLRWAEGYTAAGGAIGFGCLDIVTLKSCGFLQSGVAPVAQTNGTQIGGTGIPATNGTYWYMQGTGDFVAVNASGAIYTTVKAGAAVSDGYSPVMSATFGGYAFGEYKPAGSSTYNLYCTTTAAPITLCPGFPKAIPAVGTANSGAIMPILNASGTLTGVCSMPGWAANGSATTCWTLSGSTTPNPYPVSFGPPQANYANDAFIRGTKVYNTWQQNQVGCFDFATNALCAGFTNPSNAYNYTVRDASKVAPNCLVADGDGRQITFFNAITGRGCVGATSPASMTVTPLNSYCGSGVTGFRGWGALTIPGLLAGTYTNSTVTLRDQNNAIITGFNNVTLAAGGSLTLSTIPTTVTSITATVTVNGVNDPSGVITGQISITWVGDPPQMCFQTIAPPSRCSSLSTAVTNQATAVTTSAAGSDAPNGNTTGTTTFTNNADLSPTSTQCVLVYQKTASTQSARPGDKVTYTITVTNAGTQDYTSLAGFSDDLTDVLNDAVYNNDAAASAGTVSYTAPTLSWAGGLAAGATVTITYSVTVNSPDTGDHALKNTVVSPAQGNNNCRSGSADTRCTATVTISDLSITKTADSSAVHVPARVGDVVTYHFSATNTGQTTLTGVAITDPHPGLSALTYSWPGTAGVLLAGQTVTATATYLLTQTDLNNATVVNSAIASGNPPTGPPATSPPSGATVPVVQGPALALTKTANASGVSSPARVGDVIAYTFTATNTGNVTLTGVEIVDALPGLSALIYTWPGAAGTLAPGEAVTATATYRLTADDVAAGHVANSANASGSDPSGHALTTPYASVDTPLLQSEMPTVSG
ncbi:hypothetical protein SB754_16425 [Leifsonia sp. SIMBA_070]